MARAPDDDDVDLGVSLETVATVVDLARSIQGKEETDADQATEDANSESALLQETPDDMSEDALRLFITELNEDEQASLIALAWIGRGDYGSEDWDEARALAAEAPGGIDVYFDNVGGDHLDAAFAAARSHARFAICGMIDIYNDMKPTELRYLARVIGARVTMRGFIVLDWMNEFPDIRRRLAAFVQDGRLRYRVDERATVELYVDGQPAASLPAATRQNWRSARLASHPGPPPGRPPPAARTARNRSRDSGGRGRGARGHPASTS